ncbi:MAG: nucleoside recognition domain-containing protein [Terrimicrobiaceae bacterium]|nr:nucleoside recognition domain-containing protein [Terrimicrobiaceae bacterium]
MLNYIWLALVVLAVLMGGFSGQLQAVTNAAFEACKTAVMTIALPLAGVMALWLGLMKLAEKAGLVAVLARAVRPVLRWLFPDVPANHPAMGAMVMNTAANMLGLANAATPLGLRAMQDLERLNPHPGTATNAMCTFLAINTSSVQLIPATTVAILAAAGSVQPTQIIGTAFVATCCSTLAGIVAVKSFERLPMFAPPVATREIDPAETENSEDARVPGMPWWGAGVLALFFASFVWFAVGFASAPAQVERGLVVAVVDAISYLAIPFLVAFFPLYAALRRVPVYEEFVEGAKEGFQVAVRIIPYLVAIIAAVAMFRAAGGIDLLTRALGPVLAALHFPPELLPLSLMRPLSGSGANGLFAELVQAHGPDSLVARMGATIMGSTETTFYVIAVYFGSVAVRRTRHAVPAGLCADLAGIVASVVICNLVFG